MLKVVTTAEAARQLGITPSGVARRVYSGALEPAAKLAGIRGAYLFEPAEIERAKREGER